MSLLLKVLTLVLILSFLNNEISSSTSIRTRRSPDFWNSVKGVFGITNPPVVTTTENPCLEYSIDGDCLGNIEEEPVEYKCVFCKNSNNCRMGSKQDRFGKCRKIIKKFGIYKFN